MNYTETTEYLYAQLPMFERQGADGYKAGLENSRILDEHFGHPHRKYSTIHIAGTNGKGSCSHTLAAILQECGYKVGLYTSPHLADFRERIRINGRPISKEYVVSFVDNERAFYEPLHPTFFEITTAMAFKYFKDMQVDIAVIETGMGGRLDCTNIIKPIVSVITNISYDHTQFLGNTLKKIAAEKAGIIKKGVPVVIGEATPDTRQVFEDVAAKKHAQIVFAENEPEVTDAAPTADNGMEYQTRHFGTLKGDLGGIYQQKNMNTILTVQRMLEKMGYMCDCKQANNIEKCIYEISEAVKNVCNTTGLMGRWQTIRTAPHVVCDTGHNVAGWEYLSRQLSSVNCQQMHIIFGMVDDKDLEGVIKLLPKNALYYFTKANNKRSLPETVIQSYAAKYDLAGLTYPSVYEAYKAAIEQAAHDDFIFIGGSTYVVGEFLKNCI